MKISLALLKKLIDFNYQPKELAQTLTFLGIETSVLSENAAAWSDVFTAKVLQAQKHPNADKLSLCEVTDGTNTYSIVCGAPNVKADQIVALAKIGAVLPGGITIKKSKIRGVESEGMICSEAELGLSSESQGIMELPAQTKIGIPFENPAGENDAILEIEITPNRGDCLSHIGIAREIAAKLRKNVSPPVIKTQNSLVLNRIKVESELCPRYIGTMIVDVKVAPSPKWLSDVLTKCAVRSINNIVDITNYVMIELGQPLHAFDINKLDSGKIVVRIAKENESILALDGKEYKLDPKNLIIADDKKPAAIAGIMGGENSSIDENTQTIILESAVFNASSVRASSKRLKLSSDSSYRYERGVDIAMCETAAWRAANLITQIAGGRIAGRDDIFPLKTKKNEIVLRLQRVKKVLGYAIDEKEIGAILRALGIDLHPLKEVLLCIVPSWRNDIKEEIDLIEEIARLRGYENVPQTSMACKISDASKDSFFPEIVKEFRTRLLGLGFCEAMNYSFSKDEDLEIFGLKSAYKIINPASKDDEVLRPSLLPGLYKNLSSNIAQGAESVCLFEYAKVYGQDGEKETFAFLAFGNVWRQWWKLEGEIREYDFHFGGGTVKNILPQREFFIKQNLSPAQYFHPGKTASILYRGKPIGAFGIISPLISADLKSEVFYFEMDIEPVKDIKFKDALFEPFAKFPPVKRDISIVADKNLQFEKIENVLKGMMKGGGLLRDFEVFSVYSNVKKIGKDKVGYSLRLTYRDNEKTLTDEQANKDVEVLLEKLNKELGIVLRT